MLKFNLASITFISFMILFCCNTAISNPTKQPTELNEINIGIMAPFSGDYADYGNYIWQGAQEAAIHINSQGGIAGKQLQLVRVDDFCQIRTANIAASQIILRNIKLVVGPACSGTLLTSIEALNEAKVLTVTPSATHDEITKKNYSRLFQLMPSNSQQAEILVDFLTNKLQAKRIAIISDQMPYAKNLADLVNEKLAKATNPPIIYQGINRGQVNFKKIVNKLTNLNADAIFFAGLHKEIGALSKAIHQSNLQIPLLTGDSVAFKAYLKKTGGNKYAAATIMSFSPDLRKSIQSLELLNNLSNQTSIKLTELGGFTLNGYASIEILAQALLATLSLDPDKIAHWLHHNKMHSIIGPISFSTNGELQGAKYNMYIWDNLGNYSEIQYPNKH